MTANDHRRIAEILPPVDRAVTETLLLRRDPPHPTATGTATFLEHRPQVPQVGVTNLRPCLLQRARLALLHSPQLSHVEATQLLQRLLGLEAAVVADLRTIRLVTSLVPRHAVDLGEADLAVVASTAAELRLDLVAQEVALHRLRHPSEALATLQQLPIRALCASAITSPIFRRRYLVVKKLLRSMTRAGFSSWKRMPENSGK